MRGIFYSTLSNLPYSSPLESQTIRCRKDLLSKVFETPLRRVNVLDGHTGRINALTWANDGETLISGGDDKTVRLWGMNQGTDDLQQEYPFVCNTTIRTGHTSTIFGVQMLPFSSRIVTASRDKQVRVFDIEKLHTSSANATGSAYVTAEYNAAHNCHVIDCHSRSVKRIVTESSPDLFMTVSEDGSVRQHDLRIPHTCSRSIGCSNAPLVKLRHRLFTMSLSPLTPCQFVVAGGAPYGYLFDRRQIGRFLEAEWGMPVDSDHITTCVRRFARKHKEGTDWMDYITGVRMSDSGHEVIMSYAGDSIYLFSTEDNPTTARACSSRLMEPNVKRQKTDAFLETAAETIGPGDLLGTPHEHVEQSSYNQDEGGDTDSDDASDSPLSGVPVLLPKVRYTGILNVQSTTKDVNFLGPRNDFVVSGSEDGNFFVWRRSTGILHGIYEGDGSMVNVIEPHPHLPVIAVSGLDDTVKLFTPGDGPNIWSRMDSASAIIAYNSDCVTNPDFAADFQHLLYNYRIVISEGDQCNFQ